MPFVRIDVDASRTKEQVKAISDSVYQALVDSVHAPANDLFHVVNRHPRDELVFSKDYLGISRTDHFVSVQIFLYAGRTIEQKKLIFKTIAQRLEANAGVKQSDVFIQLVDTPKENWSYGNGEAQFAPGSTSSTVPTLSFLCSPWTAPAALALSLISLLIVLVLFLKKA